MTLLLLAFLACVVEDKMCGTDVRRMGRFTNSTQLWRVRQNYGRALQLLDVVRAALGDDRGERLDLRR